MDKIDKNEKMTLVEFARMRRMTLKKAEYYVCDCDLLYGFLCDYHSNPGIKLSIKEWKDKMYQCGRGWTCLLHLKKKNHYKEAFKAVKSKLEGMNMDARKDFLKNCGFKFNDGQELTYKREKNN